MNYRKTVEVLKARLVQLQHTYIVILLFKKKLSYLYVIILKDLLRWKIKYTLQKFNHIDATSFELWWILYQNSSDSQSCFIIFSWLGMHLNVMDNFNNWSNMYPSSVIFLLYVMIYISLCCYFYINCTQWHCKININTIQKCRHAENHHSARHFNF